MIDYDSKLPYYTQLKEWMIDQIEQGVYQNGDKLPSELDLARQQGISRPTVRQALAELVQEGYLVKKKGLGTFVSSPLITGNANVFTTFAEEMMASGFQHRAKLIRKKQIIASEKIAKELQINKGSEVFEIVRLRLANEEPLVIRTSYIPCELYPALLEEDLEEIALYDLLNRRGYIQMYSKQSFQAVSAFAEEAQLLRVPQGSPLILWDGIVYDQRQKPIEKFRARYLGSRFRFKVEQTSQHGMLNVQGHSPTLSLPNF